MTVDGHRMWFYLADCRRVPGMVYSADCRRAPDVLTIRRACRNLNKYYVLQSVILHKSDIEKKQ